MKQIEDVFFRKFEEKDIPNKINWINNPSVNKFLHYELPLEYDKTLLWYRNICMKADRADFVIEIKNNPIGLIGLLNINGRKTEFYIAIGEDSYRGKGWSKYIIKSFLDMAFKKYEIDIIYLQVEKENYISKRAYESVGFKLADKESFEIKPNSESTEIYLIKKL